MEWDLYLDESGKFKQEGERTLIGGVLLPRRDKDNMRLLAEWRDDIRSRIAESGIYTGEDLLRGDSLHDLNIIEKRKNLQPQQTDEHERLKASKYYIFDHCSENISTPDRWGAQRWVLSQYVAKLKEAGGAIVVFDNPGGVYRIDSNTTYMTIFANGLVRLYADLKRRNPQEYIYLYTHAASRINITQQKEEAKYKVSPVAGAFYTLEKELYINQVKNCVFLNGGYHLLELEAFNRSLESFDIISDEKKAGKTVSHPATVICDYVCNSRYVSASAAHQRRFKAFYQGEDAYCYNVFDGPLSSPDFGEDLDAQNHDWGRQLKTLVSWQFPKERTRNFFARLKREKKYDQMLCVRSLSDYLKPFVINRENMPEWVERIQLIIRRCVPMEAEAYANLKANMLLYLNTLYTHMGRLKEVQKTVGEFILCAAKIREITLREELFVMFLNRQIVNHTDLFRFDRAAEFFHVLEKYMEKRLQCGDDFLLDCALLTEHEAIPDTVCEQYGRAIGSYVQLLAKKLRTAPGKERAEIEGEAGKIIPKVCSHFWKSHDISRGHQNLCGLYAEKGDYDEALKELCLSMSLPVEGPFEEQAAALLKAAGHYGRRDVFAYYHYVYLMHRCVRSGDERGGIMLDRILSEAMTAAKLAPLKQAQHPQNAILWHLAASLAKGKQNPSRARELFEASKEMLAEPANEPIFRTIGIAVASEEIACGLEGLLTGKGEKWEEEAKRFLRETYPSYAAKASVDPFADVIQTAKMRPLDPGSYYAIADTIPY
ncbi:MAG: hypothetical protein ACOYI7_00610 [Candidatus Excrementavichristensenella sp.]|jgi:hypothetical protein